MAPKCEVCCSPTANTLHFGGRSCKACAAFFRRTVAMDVTYSCLGDNGQCDVHFELRMSCRHCRYLKCLQAGMTRKLVQSRHKSSSRPKRKPEDAIASLFEEPHFKVIRGEALTAMGEMTDAGISKPTLDLLADVMSGKPSIMLPPPMPANMAAPRTPQTKETIIKEEQVEEPETIVPPSCSTSSLPSPRFCPSEAASSRSVIDEDNGKSWETIETFLRVEGALNARRRMMHTDCGVSELMRCTSDLPFRKDQLKPFDYRKFHGYDRFDFITIFDYICAFPEFELFNPTDKCILYRYACAVDCTMSCAYYTSRLGAKDHQLVLFNGQAINMNPLPPTGLEKWYELNFNNKEELMIYRTIMPAKIKQWQDMALPFSALNVSFEEYCLLKAVTIYHIAFYKLSENGRKHCERLRDNLLNSIHWLCLEEDQNPAERMGTLLLAMGLILQQVHELTNSFVMMTFFDIVKCDELAVELIHCRFNGQ